MRRAVQVRRLMRVRAKVGGGEEGKGRNNASNTKKRL